MLIMFRDEIRKLMESDENKIKEIERNMVKKILKDIKDYFKIGEIITDGNKELGTIVDVDNRGFITVELNKEASKKFEAKITSFYYAEDIEVKREN
ncbi:hypothetical protein C4D31_11245 [Clostridium perfringens]